MAMNTQTPVKIKSIITDLFELLPSQDQQQLLNRLKHSLNIVSSTVQTKRSRKEFILQIALELNRETQSNKKAPEGA